MTFTYETVSATRIMSRFLEEALPDEGLEAFAQRMGLSMDSKPSEPEVRRKDELPVVGNKVTVKVTKSSVQEPPMSRPRPNYREVLPTSWADQLKQINERPSPPPSPEKKQ